MTLNTPWKRGVGATVLALSMLACGSDDSGDATDGGADGSMSGDGGGDNGAASGSGDGGTGGDASATNGEDGSSSGGEDGGNGDAAGNDGGGNDGGGDSGGNGNGDGGDTDAGPTPATELNLPHDGELASICYADDDCNGDDLECFAANGTAPGVCTDDCADDDDCSPIGGLDSTCSNGVCVVNCAGDAEEGDGPCPTDMECRDLAPALIGILNPNFWCVYPAEGGSNDVAELGACDTDHGDGDCQGELGCHDAYSESGPGYCTEACEEDADCTAPGGVTSTAVCGDDDMCELDCSGAGATCPAGMNCRDTNTSPISEDFRCVYID